MGLPPPQRCDHTPVYILAGDTAWDGDRLTRETKEDPTDHPWARYYRGETRADVSQVECYLVEGETPPVRFAFKRISLDRWNLIETVQARSPPDARTAALKYSLASITGTEVELARGGTETGPLSNDDLERVRALCGHEGFVELGRMAVAVSRGLLDSEKKS